MKKLSLLIAGVTFSFLTGAQAECPQVNTIEEIKKILKDNGIEENGEHWKLKMDKSYSFTAKELKGRYNIHKSENKCEYSIISESMEQMYTVGRFALVEEKK